MTARYAGPNGKRSISLRFVLIWPNEGLRRKSILPSVILERLLNRIISVFNSIKSPQNASIYHKCVTLCMSSHAGTKRPSVDKMVSLLFWWNTRWHLSAQPAENAANSNSSGYGFYAYTFTVYIREHKIQITSTAGERVQSRDWCDRSPVRL